jgi:hypothetical protein
MPIFETLAGAIPTIWDGIAAIRSAAINRDGLLIAYRYEVGANIALLRELNTAALKDTDISSPEFKNLVMCLETQVGVSILYDSNRKNYHSFMKSLANTSLNLVPVDENGEKDTIANLQEAMRFSVRKIEHLKRLAHCATGGSGLFKEFRLNVRVKNIFDSLNIIEANLPSDAAKKPPRTYPSLLTLNSPLPAARTSG